jgi:hypothetical protein
MTSNQQSYVITRTQQTHTRPVILAQLSDYLNRRTA